MGCSQLVIKWHLVHFFKFDHDNVKKKGIFSFHKSQYRVLTLNLKKSSEV